MGRSRLAWAKSTVAPWLIGLGLVVSITAEAGQEPAQSQSAYARMVTASPVRQAIAASSLALARGLASRDARPIIEARLMVGEQDDLAATPDEIEPNGALKAAAKHFPEIDRTAKSDPFVGLRPGFEARLRHAPIPSDVSGAWPNEIQNPADEEFDPGHTMSPMGPRDTPAAAPPRALSFDDGATPAAPLDFALNSSTPQPNEGRLVVATARRATPQPTIAPQTTLAARTEQVGQPNYAALIDPKDSARQMRCLADAIYFESRSEPEAGQAAVAQVVLNRVRSGIYPTSVCGVVYQDRQRPFACQFSFACEGKSLRIEEPGPWATATRIAQEVVAGTNYNPKVGEAVNYHANYVNPFWRGYLRQVDRIGNHIFYAMRSGVNWAPGALNGNGDKPPTSVQ